MSSFLFSRQETWKGKDSIVGDNRFREHKRLKTYYGDTKDLVNCVQESERTWKTAGVILVTEKEDSKKFTQNLAHHEENIFSDLIQK